MTPSPTPPSPPPRGALGAFIASSRHTWRHNLRQGWAALQPRERRLVAAGAALVGAFGLWSVALAPALRTLGGAADELRRLDLDIAAMRTLAAEAKGLHACAHQPPPADAALAWRQATEQHLGTLAQVGAEKEEPPTVTLSQAPAELMFDWLVHLREAAHAAPVQASLEATGEGLWNGRLSFALPAARPNP